MLSIENGTLLLNPNGSITTLQPSATGNRIITMPDITDTLISKTSTDILTNKTLTDNTNNIISRGLWIGSGTGSISTYAATAPTSGQVLTAVNGTTANWQTPITNAIISLNALTNGTQTFATGSSGTDFGIHALNASNGQETTSISTTGIQAIGNHYIRRIGVADDGKIYVCSLSVAGTPFAIYRYTNEADTATLIYTGTTTVRQGDVFRVAGSGSNTRLYVSGGLSVTGPPGFVNVFDGNGTNLFTITLNTAAGASAVTGIATQSTTGNLWVTKSDGLGFYSWKKVDSTGTILDSINTTIVPIVSSNGILVQLPGTSTTRTCLLTNDATIISPNAHGIVVDITSGGAAANILAITTTLVNTSAGASNGTFEAALDTVRGAFIALIENNSIGSYGNYATLPVTLSRFETEAKPAINTKKD